MGCSEKTLERAAHQALLEFDQAREAYDRLRHEYFASAPGILRGFLHPAKPLTPDAVERLDALRHEEQRKEDTWWRAMTALQNSKR